MDANLKLGKPQEKNISPLIAFSAKCPEDIPGIEQKMLGLLKDNQECFGNRKHLEELWTQTRAARISKCQRFFAILCTDNNLIICDFDRLSVQSQIVEIEAEIQLCNFFIDSRWIVFGGLHHIILYEFRAGTFTTLQFQEKQNLSVLSCGESLIEQRKVVRILKKRKKLECVDFSGDFVYSTRGKLDGITGILYTREQYIASHHILETKEDQPFVLQVNQIEYVESEAYKLNEKILFVEFKESDSMEIAQGNYLIIRCDSLYRSCVIALNSSHKFFCQFFVMSIETGNCQHTRPISFISGSDILPTDKYGRTSMLISDIAWDPSDLFFVVCFSANYCCAVSRIGEPLSIISNNFGSPLQHFFSFTSPTVIEQPELLYHTVKVTTHNICVISDSKAIFLPHTHSTHWWYFGSQDSSYGRINSILKMILSLPEASTKPAILDTLGQILDSEIVYFSQQSRISNESFKQIGTTEMDAIKFKNPFPVEPAVETAHIVKTTMSIIDSIRWTRDISNNLLELFLDEIENSARLLFVKNEPLYFLQIASLFKLFLKKFQNSRVKIYNYMKQFSKPFSFSIEKKRVLLLFYCLIQFRNFKATSFNILYLVTTGILKEKWGKNPHFSNTLAQVIKILKSNISVKKLKKQDFFDTELKTNLQDKGILYNRALEICEHFLVDEESPLLPAEDSGDRDLGTIEDPGKAEPEKNEAPTKFSSYSEALLQCLHSDPFDFLHTVVSRQLLTRNTLDIVSFCESALGYETSPMSHLYRVLKSAKKLEFQNAIKYLQPLLKSFITSEILQIQDFKIERWQNITILTAAYLMLSLCFLTRGKLLNPIEVPTYLSELIEAENLSEILPKYKKISAEVVGTIDERCTFLGIGILMQFSAHRLCIQLLREKALDLHEDFHSNLLLTFIILNNKLNQASDVKKELIQQKIETELLGDCDEILSQLFRDFPQLVLKQCFKSQILQEIMLNTNHTLAARVAFGAFSNLISVTANLININMIIPEQMFSLKAESGSKTNSLVCTPVLSALAQMFCKDDTLRTCNNFLSLYFLNCQYASLFNILIQELYSVFCTCCQLHLLELIPENVKTGEMVRVKKGIFGSHEEEMKILTMKLLQLFWQTGLLLAIERLKQEPELTANSSLRFAGYLFRFSIMGINEQRELEYIQQGFALLKKVKYHELKPSTHSDSEAINDLGNALEKYTEKWETIIESEKAEIVALLKASNSYSYKLLNNYFSKRKTSLRSCKATSKHQINLSSDIVFVRMLHFLKTNTTEQASVKNRTGSELKNRLYATLEDIESITGIPKSTLILRDSKKWKVIVEMPFAKRFDKTGEEYKCVGSKNENFNFVPPSLCVDDFGKYHYALSLLNPITYRGPHFKGLSLRTSKKELPPLQNIQTLPSIHKIPQSEKMKLECFIKEQAAENLQKIIHKKIVQCFNILKRTNLPQSQASKYSKLLVAKNKRLHARQKSVSLTTQEQEVVQPFAIYTIRKDKVGSTAENTKAKNTPRGAKEEVHFSTEEDKCAASEGVAKRKPTHKRTASASRPFALIKVPVSRTGVLSPGVEAKRQAPLDSELQSKIEKINQRYEKIKIDANKVKVTFLDRIKQQILTSKKKL